MGAATRLMIFMADDDRVNGQPLHEHLLARARQLPLAGATMWRGIEGYGRSRLLRTNRLSDANTGLPMVMEAIDAPDRITAFLRDIDAVVGDALITLESVVIVDATPPAP